jgi:hypothetical protein
VMRNKLGGAGDATSWMAAIDPLSAAPTIGLERFADLAAPLLWPRLRQRSRKRSEQASLRAAFRITDSAAPAGGS